MSETKPVVLNSATVWSIQQTGSREKALEFLDSMSKYVEQPDVMRQCLRDGRPFKGLPREEGYFRYLVAALELIDELYPEKSARD